jgi:APA family basic amino acid/polyamine antiporter
MLNLAATTWIRFGVWMAVGLVVYFFYSYRHSRLSREHTPASRPGGQSARVRRGVPAR